MAPLGAFRVSFSETQANNSSEFPLFLHFISARNARTAVKHIRKDQGKNGKNKERSIKQKGNK